MDIMSWRDIYVVAMGKDPPVKHLPPALASGCLYGIVLLFCLVMHKLSHVFLPKEAMEFALDFFKTLAFVTYAMGHGLIRTYHGHVGYCLAMVPLNVLTLHLMKAGHGTPLGNWTQLLRGHVGFVEFVLRVAVQILAGLVAWRLGRFVYSLDLHPMLTENLHQAECVTALNVPVYLGFLLEMGAVLYDTWLGCQFLTKVHVIEDTLKMLNAAILVSLGCHMTGMFIHPAMATGLSFGCRGTAPLEHILVYWVGPFIGVFVALQLDKYVYLWHHIHHTKAELIATAAADHQDGPRKKHLGKQQRHHKKHE